MTYTIGLKRKFLPGYRKFKVTNHEVAGTEGTYRLLLTCADGCHIYACTDSFKLYKDFHVGLTALEREKERLAAVKHEAISEYQLQLAQQMQNQRTQQPLAPQQLAQLRAQQG